MTSPASNRLITTTLIALALSSTCANAQTQPATADLRLAAPANVWTNVADFTNGSLGASAQAQRVEGVVVSGNGANANLSIEDNKLVVREGQYNENSAVSIHLTDPMTPGKDVRGIRWTMQAVDCEGVDLNAHVDASVQLGYDVGKRMVATHSDVIRMGRFGAMMRFDDNALHTVTSVKASEQKQAKYTQQGRGNKDQNTYFVQKMPTSPVTITLRFNNDTLRMISPELASSTLKSATPARALNSAREIILSPRLTTGGTNFRDTNCRLQIDNIKMLKRLR